MAPPPAPRRGWARRLLIASAVALLAVAAINLWPSSENNAPSGSPGGGGTAPTAVHNLQAHTTASTVTLTWRTPTGVTADAFRIERDGRQIGEVAAGVTTFTDRNVAFGTRYTYGVIAVADGTAGTPAAVTLKTGVPSIGAAVFSGSYRVHVQLTAAQGWQSLHAGSHSSEWWSFSTNGTHMSGGSPGGSWTMPLHRNGAKLNGSAHESQSTCFLKPVVDTLTLDLRVTAARVIDGKWVATRFTGTLRDSAPAASSGLYTCPGSSYTARVAGVRS